MSSKPTADNEIDHIIDMVAVGDSQLHTKAVIDPLVAAARRELQVLRELCEAYMIGPEEVRKGLGAEIAWNTRMKAAYQAYRQWRAEQEQQK